MNKQTNFRLQSRRHLCFSKRKPVDLGKDDLLDTLLSSIKQTTVGIKRDVEKNGAQIRVSLAMAALQVAANVIYSTRLKH